MSWKAILKPKKEKLIRCAVFVLANPTEGLLAKRYSRKILQIGEGAIEMSQYRPYTQEVEVSPRFAPQAAWPGSVECDISR